MSPCSGDDHYYSGGYSADDDPYVYPNGVLVNLLGITDTQTLGEAEADLASVRIIQLQETPIEGDFSLKHLCSIHHFIFQDVYPWAGELRRVDIAKNETIFLSHAEIDTAFEIVAEQIAAADGFAKYRGNLHQFADAAGIVLGSVNHVHPFREGNGRTQREYLDRLAWRAGFAIEWAGVSKLAMKDACVASLSDPDCRALAKLIRLSAKPHIS
jgi:cell filamentation protein